VKDGAIPEGGRKVRCAACGHSWHQDPEGAGAVEPDSADGVAEQASYAADETRAPEAAPRPYANEPSPPSFEEEPGQPEAAGYEPEAVQAGGHEPLEPQPVDDGRDESEASDYPPPEPESTGYETVEPAASDDDLVEPPSAVPVPPPGEERWPQVQVTDDQWDLQKELPDREEIEAVESETGSDRKRNWLMAAIIVIVLVVAIVAGLWFLAPDSIRQQIGIAGAPTPLQIAPGTPERQKLASGNELVMVSGRVINPSGKVQPVPPIQAELRDKAGKLLYSWTITPPARSLQPGASATFNSAQMDVPASGLDSTVTLSLKG
jgi:hypothetical protein